MGRAVFMNECGLECFETERHEMPFDETLGGVPRGRFKKLHLTSAIFIGYNKTYPVPR